MADTPKNPAAARIPVVTYTTPDIRDVVFYILVDSKLPKYEAPAYASAFEGVGDTHGLYENHRLVYISKADETGWVKWYYAADRNEQSKYNLRQVDPLANAGGLSSYTRTYFVLKNLAIAPALEGIWDAEEDWTAAQLWQLGDYSESQSKASGKTYVDTWELQYGQDDPDESYHPEFSGYKFTSQEVREVPDKELASLYVIVERRFEKLFPQRYNVYNPFLGSVVSKITTTKLHDEVGFQNVDENGNYTEFKDVNNNWSHEIERVDLELSKIGHTLTGGSYDPSSCSSFTSTIKWIKSTDPVENGIGADGLYRETVPVNTKMSRVVTKPSTNHLLLGKPMKGAAYDANSGLVSPVTITYVESSEVDDGSISATGDIVEYRPVSPCISKKIERNVRPFQDRSYSTVINYSLPRVLEAINVKSWDLRLGGSQYFLEYVWKRQPYSGPCKAVITETWSTSPPAVNTTPVGLSTTSVQFQCPFFSVNSGPCLAPAIAINVFIGNRDPRWKSAGTNYVSQASAFTDWPASFIVQEDVKPMAGGWFHRTVEVYTPI